MIGVNSFGLLKDAVRTYMNGYESINGERLSKKDRKRRMYAMNQEFYGHMIPYIEAFREVSATDVLSVVLGSPSEAREIMEDLKDSSMLAESALVVNEFENNTKMFSQILGQIAYLEVMASYQMPALIGRSLVDFSYTNFLDGEKIPGITPPSDDFQIVGEGMPYPPVGLGANFVETPRPIKRGLTLYITRELMIAERLGLLMDRARGVGEMLSLNQEKDILSTILGATASYKRNSGNNGQPVATYGDVSGAHTWDNNVASNPLTDATSIQAMIFAFEGMTDPDTGEPIVLNAGTLLVPQALEFRARDIVNAREVRRGNVTSAYETISPNPISGRITQVLTSPYISTIQGNSTSYYLLDGKRAFGYKAVWDNEVVTLDMDTSLVTRDVVAGLKCGNYGVPWVKEPRYSVRSLAS